jgi:N-acetylglucosamine malate deacetylase 1
MVPPTRSDITLADVLEFVLSTYDVEQDPSNGRNVYPTIQHLSVDPEARILILSPHQDDDVIGCGGTIKKHCRAGASVKVVFMTDGRYGNTEFEPKELAEIRRKEATESLAYLGCKEIQFFKNPDMGLVCDSSNVYRLNAVLRDFHPTAIFAPSFADGPPDHYNTSKILAYALMEYDEDVTIYTYEVWQTLVPTIVMDISDVIEDKLKAIAFHRSQVAVMDYPRMVRGLNEFRSLLGGKGCNYCEAFAMFTKEGYIHTAMRLGVMEYTSPISLELGFDPSKLV